MKSRLPFRQYRLTTDHATTAYLRAREDRVVECERKGRSKGKRGRNKTNKAGYTATPSVAFGWAGEVVEKVTRALGQKQ